MGRGCAQRSVSSLAPRSMNTVMTGKAAVSIYQVKSPGSSMLRAPLGREETLQKFLISMNTCEYTQEGKVWQDSRQ